MLFCRVKNKFGPHVFGADDIDVLLVGIDDFLYNGKPKPGTFAVLATGGINFIEPIPDFPQTGFGNTAALVLHGNENRIVFQGGFHFNHRLLRAEFNGIVNEVIEYLLNLSHIGPHKQGLAGQQKFDGNPFLPAGALKGFGSAFYDTVDVKIRIIQLPSLFIQIVQSQETLGQLVEAVGFMHHDFQVFLLHFRRNGTV